MNVIIGVIIYWLVGVYSFCWYTKIESPARPLESIDIFFAMTFFWMFAPFYLIATLLHIHFNKPKN